LFNLNFLAAIRSRELDEILALIPAGAKVLDFGAGTGGQAKILADRGHDVVAIDLPTSGYAVDRVFPVMEFDGEQIPLDDSSIDVIFSSNVLEHVENLPAVFDEFKRILRPGGSCVHVMPTPAWRFWTFVAGVPTAVAASGQLVRQVVTRSAPLGRKEILRRNAKAIAGALLPIGHGTSVEGISELWTFSPTAWRRRFARSGFRIVEDRPLEIFYTGHMALGDRLSFNARSRLARRLGSASHLYVVVPENRRPDPQKT
jgi:SAM-dependent methyltransferase